MAAQPAFLPVLASALALGAALFFVGLDEPPAAGHGAPSKATRTETGLASYYGRRFEGRQTASGEKFSNQDLSAAHPSHPLGTKVRVTNLENGTSVIVRINDRGASAQNRREGVIIDVSQAAADRLEMKKEGRVRVRVAVLEWGEDYHPPLAEVKRFY